MFGWVVVCKHVGDNGTAIMALNWHLYYSLSQAH
jgi:hypothetical protein